MADFDPGKGPTARLRPGAPGVLYFDPNPTTARLAAAGLRLAGYEVFLAPTEERAVDLCTRHGPGGDKAIVALLLDTATSPSLSAAVLRALIQVPGAEDLPGILLVSRTNPQPIPGAEDLPTLKRPFTTPALLKAVRDAIDTGPPARSDAGAGESVSHELLARLERVLARHLPNTQVDEASIRALAAELVHDATLPTPAAGVTLTAELGVSRLEGLLGLLDGDAVRGVLQIDQGTARVRIHLDRGRIRMADFFLHAAAEGVSGDEDLRLGRFVVEAGLMTNEALESLMALPDHERRPLGQRLLEDGHLRPGELARTVLQQAREVTCHALTWRQGVATFAPSEQLHPLAEALASQAELPIANVLLEGLRRIEEQAEMGPHMATIDDVFLRDDDRVTRFGRNAFTRDELAVLELANGRNSVKEVARKTRTGTLSVAKILYRLSRAGLVRRRIVPVGV